MTLFSQYLRDISIPCCIYKRKDGCMKSQFDAFKLFPVLLTILLMWGLCALLTAVAWAYDNPESPTYNTTWSGSWLYKSFSTLEDGTLNISSIKANPGRTDVKLSLLTESLWFRFPYPCKCNIC